MFNDSDSFIYSPTGDITNTQQKQCGEHYDNTLPVWKRVSWGDKNVNYMNSTYTHSNFRKACTVQYSSLANFAFSW